MSITPSNPSRRTVDRLTRISPHGAELLDILLTYTWTDAETHTIGEFVSQDRRFVPKYIAKVLGERLLPLYKQGLSRNSVEQIIHVMLAEVPDLFTAHRMQAVLTERDTPAPQAAPTELHQTVALLSSTVQQLATVVSSIAAQHPQAGSLSTDGPSGVMETQPEVTPETGGEGVVPSPPFSPTDTPTVTATEGGDHD